MFCILWQLAQLSTWVCVLGEEAMGNMPKRFKVKQKELKQRLSMLAHPISPNTQEAEAGQFGAGGQPELQNKTNSGLIEATNEDHV